MKSVENLAQRLGIPLPPAASEAEIAETEAAISFKLTAGLRDLYTTCNGLVFDAQSKILSLEDVRTKWVPGLRDYGIPQVRNYFPFTDYNDSNPYCVCCDDVMSEYVVLVSHDDSARVKFRSLDAYFTALASHVRLGEWDSYQLQSELDNPQRTAKDIEIGLKLLEQARQLDDVERLDTFRFGMWLLSEQQIEQIVPILEDHDWFVSREAKERLAAMKTPAGEQALADFKKRMTDFIDQCVVALKQAGVEVTKIDYDDPTIRLDPGPVYLNIPAFYAEQHRRADIFEWLVERSRTFLERERIEREKRKKP